MLAAKDASTRSITAASFTLLWYITENSGDKTSIFTSINYLQYQRLYVSQYKLLGRMKGMVL